MTTSASETYAVARRVARLELIARVLFRYGLVLAIGWIGAMKPGAAIGMSWNAKVLPRPQLVGILLDHGLEPKTSAAHLQFEHRVDQAITRDLVVAVKPE